MILKTVKNNQSSLESVQTTKISKKSRGKILLLIIVLAILAVGGWGFGGVELWRNIENSQRETSTVLLSLDKDSDLGKKLYEQIRDIHPLYYLSDNEYAIKYEDISSATEFDIIAKRIPEIAALENDGEKVTVSGERMEEILNSIFGCCINIDYNVFGFVDSDSEKSVRLSDYNIERIGNNEYVISFEMEPRPVEAARYFSRYEYVGLSNTIDNQLTDGIENGTQTEKAMIVLEKKTVDVMTEDDKGYSDGYYGVLFMKHGEDFFWVGTYYLGNVIER